MKLMMSGIKGRGSDRALTRMRVQAERAGTAE